MYTAYVVVWYGCSYPPPPFPTHGNETATPPRQAKMTTVEVPPEVLKKYCMDTTEVSTRGVGRRCWGRGGGMQVLFV